MLVIAALNAFTGFLAWRTHTLTKQIEVATNSMKDALVKSTGDASYAAGRDFQRIESEAKAADVALGRKQT